MVSTAIKEVEKEHQEAEIQKIKDIVKKYLEKIQSKKEKVKEEQEELRALEKDLDDLKAGRLDKIEERQGKDPVHDRVKIIEIHRIETQYVPYYPWRSPYQITYYQPYCTTTYSDSNYYGLATSGTISGTTYTLTSSTSALQGMTTGSSDYSTFTQANQIGYGANSSQLSNVSNAMSQITGTMFQNFTGGSYEINGHIINL